ncbi:MAG: hypothetical protein AVDCRST_MAG64-1488 [uncultured Phycisphaerae bacterium]|uniref:DUF488 domain-containing protein n=1 Tax=uncultured Phycisphaerae bacterium TaxID=904963 RepID=A0A6J4NW51_9BACT|nr:MAG: hypothetical protein AVDCRST_MAG64-1488 [uncultured Phycisphaerae bacterium]
MRLMPTGTIQTRRWNDPPLPDEGVRVLVTRYRPRGVAKSDETWDEWDPDLGPSVGLHAAAYGKGVLAIPWDTYRVLYLREMRQRKGNVAALADRVASGQAIALLCSSACDRESRCHRSLLKGLIEAEIARRQGDAAAGAPQPPDAGV